VAKKKKTNAQAHRLNHLMAVETVKFKEQSMHLIEAKAQGKYQNERTYAHVPATMAYETDECCLTGA
jgi:hypothetical protein